MRRVDLHVHSYYSCDGDYSPRELVNMASNNGLKAMALTDHNTVNGLSEAFAAGGEIGFEVVPGIEIDTSYLGRTFHILGYCLDWKSRRLAELIETLETTQKRLITDLVSGLRDAGFGINGSDVLRYKNKQSIPGSLTIAKAILGDRSDRDGHYLDFMQKHIAPIVPERYQQELPATEEVIQLINDLQGVAVLAHPGVYVDPNSQEELEIISTFREMGLKGIEAFSTYHNSTDNIGFYEFGVKKKLLITAGSDFHGELKPQTKLGVVPSVDFPILEMLREECRYRW